jgi:predicted alpha/beta hydrolase
MYLLGGSFGSSILGMLSDHYAHQAMMAAGAIAMAEPFKAAGIHSALYVVPIVSFTLAIVLFLASRTVAADMARLRDWMSTGELRKQGTAAFAGLPVEAAEGE